MEFHLIAQYWPADTSVWWWENFSLTVVRRDFEAARVAGVGALSIAMTWNDFQPEQGRVSVLNLLKLEKVLDVAADNGLAISLILMPVAMFSLCWIPTWCLDTERESSKITLSGHHQHRRRSRNLFATPALTSAARLLVEESIGAFSHHPAVAGWTLGDRLTAASGPPSPEIFYEWANLMATCARSRGATQPLSIGISVHDLLLDSAIEPAALRNADLGLRISLDWSPAWACADRPTWIRFAGHYGSALTAAAAELNEEPSHRSGANDLSDCIEGARLGGAASYSPLTLLDSAQELGLSLPFSRRPELLTSGILTSDRTPKEALGIWQSTVPRPVRTDIAPMTFALDVERRRQDPEGTARAAYEEFVG